MSCATGALTPAIRMAPRQAARAGSSRTAGFLGTYPPTACGLATFTSHLRSALASSPLGWDTKVVRVLDGWEPVPSSEVVAQWVFGDRASLQRSLAALESCDTVVLQHEYGIYGGRDGEDVLEALEALAVPIVAVLHTVLREPSLHQRQILDRVVAASAVVIVQSQAARWRLVAHYAVDPSRIVVIPHGAAANFVGPIRRDMPRPAVLTWGLLGPGKGIEHAIAAVARLRAHSPAASYVVAGQTHPKVRAVSGERYRQGLKAHARALWIDDRVHFEDRYLDAETLRGLIRSADVVLLPYESGDQVTSGVLVEALASAKPVVATRFPHAEELLAGNAGLLVDHGDVEAMANALDRVLYEPGLAGSMAAAARRAAIPLLWPAVAASYAALLTRIAAGIPVA